jgi:hypothetical protein
MDDAQVLKNIEALVAEEHRLWNQGEQGKLDASERARLEQLEVGLDQCWDLLRQRRALRGAGRDPDDAHVRSADTVERYLQ